MAGGETGSFSGPDHGGSFMEKLATTPTGDKNRTDRTGVNRSSFLKDVLLIMLTGVDSNGRLVNLPKIRL